MASVVVVSIHYDKMLFIYLFVCYFDDVQINTSADCNRTTGQNPFCKTNIDVSNFLNLNSLSNHNLYCLAYVFTYRDFSQGTLGLAWVGSSLSKLNWTSLLKNYLK